MENNLEKEVERGEGEKYNPLDPIQVLEKYFYKPETTDWYVPVLEAMEEYRKSSAPLPEGKGVEERENGLSKVINDYFDSRPIADFGIDTSELVENIIEYFATPNQSPKGVEGLQCLQLGISKIVDDITNGDTHPYTAKIDLLKLLSPTTLLVNKEGEVNK